MMHVIEALNANISGLEGSIVNWEKVKAEAEKRLNECIGEITKKKKRVEEFNLAKRLIVSAQNIYEGRITDE